MQGNRFNKGHAHGLSGCPIVHRSGGLEQARRARVVKVMVSIVGTNAVGRAEQGCQDDGSKSG